MERVIATNKAIIHRLFDEALNQGKLELVDELFNMDFVDHSTPEQQPGPEGVKDFFIEVCNRFPDIKVAIEDMIAEGNRVVVRTVWRSSMGMGPSASGIKGTLIQIFHLENGRIVEEWNEGSGPGEE